MGKVCSRPSNGFSLLEPQKLYQLLDIQVFSKAPRTIFAAVQKPSHCSKPFIFFVQLSNLVIRNLEAKKSTYIVVVAWDKIIARSPEIVSSGGTFSVAQDWSFRWYGGDSIDGLKCTFLIIALYRVEAFRTTHLCGYMYVPTYNLAVGPIQNDFPLFSSKAVHIEFQCRVTQICALSISCIEAVADVNAKRVADIDGDYGADEELNLTRTSANYGNPMEWRLELKSSGIEGTSFSPWTSVTRTAHWSFLPEQNRSSNISCEQRSMNSTSNPTGYATGSEGMGIIASTSELLEDHQLEVQPINSARGNPSDAQRIYQDLAKQCLSEGIIFPSPALSITLLSTSEDLREHALHVRVWNRPNKANPGKVLGDAYIPFYKLLDMELLSSSQRRFVDIQFNETLWDDGISKGTVKGILVFQDIPVLRQMIAGVNTEIGFRSVVTPAARGLAPHLPRGEKVKMLSQLLVEFQTHWDAFRNSYKSELTGYDPYAAITALSRISEKLTTLLSPSKTNPTLDYNSVEALVDFQCLLLDLAVKLTDTYPYMPWSANNSYSKLLLIILKRKEFQIGNVVPSVPLYLPEDPKEWDTIFTQVEDIDVETAFPEHYKNPNSKWSRIRNYILDSRPWVNTELGPDADPKHRNNRNSALNVLKRGEAGKVYIGPSKPLTTCDYMNKSLLGSTVGIHAEQKSYQVRPIDVRENLNNDAAYITKLDDALENYEGVTEILLFKKRLEISKSYFNLLLLILRNCIKELDGAALFENQRRFIANAMAILFNRLPTFRQHVLANVLTKEERYSYLPGWRGADFMLDKKSLDFKDIWSTVQSPGLNEIKIALDWGPFIQLLHGYYEEECNEVALVESILANHTIAWLRPRGPIFFLFLSSLIVTTCSLFESSKTNNKIIIRWDLVPGYASLLKAFLIELRTRPITKLPDAMLGCSSVLLSNDRLFSVFLRFLLHRASLYHRDQTYAAFNYIDLWIESFRQKKQPLPVSLDHRILGRSFEQTLTSDLALQMTKILWLLYRQLDMFMYHRGLVRILIEILLHNTFFTVFLHWSSMTRRSFMHVLLYRVCEFARKIVVRCYDPNDGPSLTLEERLWCWAYVILVRNLSLLGIGPVFPIKFEQVSIRRLLGRPCAPTETYTSTMLWSLPHSLPTKSMASSEAIAIKEAEDTAPLWGIGLVWESRNKGKKTDSVGKVKEHSEPTSATDSAHTEFEDPRNYIPVHCPILDCQKKYTSHASKEFADIQESYKMWIMAGSKIVPPLAIPCAPLDTNVEVPLDED